VLADGGQNVVVDTIYGTGLATYDTCRFLPYEDFLKYRIEKINLHYWYGYDTVYHFAKGHFIVRYNFCRFNRDGRSDLFIRFNDPSGANG